MAIITTSGLEACVEVKDRPLHITRDVSAALCTLQYFQKRRRRTILTYLK